MSQIRWPDQWADVSMAKVEQAFELLLEGLGVGKGPHTVDTPKRAAKAWFNELCAGLTNPPPEIRFFTSKAAEMVILRGIPIRSLCAHHLLPFGGEARIGYVPGKGEVLGLSKLSRIADYWARRPQVQEELTQQIADSLAEVVVEGEKGGVGVLIQANHLCMEFRGVRHAGDMVTSALRGVFLKPEVRAEFLQLAGFDRR